MEVTDAIADDSITAIDYILATQAQAEGATNDPRVFNRPYSDANIFRAHYGTSATLVMITYPKGYTTYHFIRDARNVPYITKGAKNA